MLQYVAVVIIWAYGHVPSDTSEPYIQETAIAQSMLECEAKKDRMVADAKTNRPAWNVKGICEVVPGEKE